MFTYSHETNKRHIATFEYGLKFGGRWNALGKRTGLPFDSVDCHASVARWRRFGIRSWKTGHSVMCTSLAQAVIFGLAIPRGSNIVLLRAADIRGSEPQSPCCLAPKELQELRHLQRAARALDMSGTLSCALHFRQRLLAPMRYALYANFEPAMSRDAAQTDRKQAHQAGAAD